MCCIHKGSNTPCCQESVSQINLGAWYRLFCSMSWAGLAHAAVLLGCIITACLQHPTAAQHAAGFAQHAAGFASLLLSRGHSQSKKLQPVLNRWQADSHLKWHTAAPPTLSLYCTVICCQMLQCHIAHNAMQAWAFDF